MFVMGPEAGREMLSGVPDVRGLWVLDKGEAERVVPWDWEAVESTTSEPPAVAGGARDDRRNH
jgi:hypothetical protein